MTDDVTDTGTQPGGKKNEPYCANCGYQLTGLVDSSKCPECGKPLVEVLTRPSFVQYAGRRWRTQTELFGWPLIHIALGPGEDGNRGKAKGIIAIGDVATGLIALGGRAIGIVAIGGFALGLFSVGGLGVGLIAALGGGAVGGLASGGGAVGIVAQGGTAVGVIADGGLAIGHAGRGGGVRARYTITPGDHWTNTYGWLIGPVPGRPILMLFNVLLTFAATVIIASIVFARLWYASRAEWDQPL